MGEIKENWKLTNLELFKEENGEFCEYFLKAEYEVDTEYVKKKITIPRMKINVRSNPLFDHRYGLRDIAPICYVDLGFGQLNCIPDSHGTCFTETILETRPRKMTLEEIEKKLGCPIELVSEKSKRGRKWEDMV